MQQVGGEGRAEWPTERQYRRDYGHGRTYQAFSVDMRAGLREYGGLGSADGDDSSPAPQTGHAVPVSQDHWRQICEVQEAAAATAVGQGDQSAVQLRATSG